MQTQDSNGTEVDNSLEERLAEGVLRRYVSLVLFARLADGTWRPGDVLHEFEVYLSDESDMNFVVQINSEDCCWTQPVSVRSFVEFDQIGPEDILIEKVAIPEHRTRRYIKGTWDGRAWKIDMCLSLPHPLQGKYANLGAEFLDAAKWALSRNLVAVFVENAFHSAENFALAELVSYEFSREAVANAKTHKTIRTTYQTWASLGNTDMRFAGVLNRLDEARTAATYLRSSREVGLAGARSMLSELEEMARWSAAVARGEGPRTVRVVANRTIAAGELVATGDVALRPRSV